MSKSRKPRRSAEEIIAEQEAKLEARKAKLVMKSASEDPRLSSIALALEGAERNLLKVRQGLSEGPQSFASRRKSHELWIEEIDAAEDYARESEDGFKDRVSYFKKSLQALSAEVANGTFDPESVETHFENAPFPAPSVMDAEVRYVQASNARKAHTDQKKSN